MPTIITRGAASATAYGFAGSASLPSPGASIFSQAGSYTWIAPTGVTKISAVAVGSGAGGGIASCQTMSGAGGSLSYLNNYSVTPGNSYTVTVSANNAAVSGGFASFNSICTLSAGGGCQSPSTYNKGTASYVGGAKKSGTGTGGGGAAGYAGNGGAGGVGPSCGGGCGCPGSGGGGGGGGGSSNGTGSGGGGVGLYGQGTSGAGGAYGTRFTSVGGGGGSNGTPGAGGRTCFGGQGGCFGGGGGGPRIPGGCYNQAPGPGAVRIVWPGQTRQFPSTNVCATGEDGSISFGSPGTYSWIAPVGVTKISVVAVGAGEKHGYQTCYSTAGQGGSLSYLNNYSVTPGTSYTLVVGKGTVAGGSGCGSSYFNNTTTVYARGGGYSSTANAGTASYTGGLGGTFSCSKGGGGGGAAGYAGNGGTGGSGLFIPGTSGSGGGGGGGGAGGSIGVSGYGGGGVGLFGQGTSGCAAGAGTRGFGGSGGCNGGNPSGVVGGTGGKYGGGGGSTSTCGGSCNGSGGSGGIRIVWPGCKRSFPSTCVGTP